MKPNYKALFYTIVCFLSPIIFISLLNFNSLFLSNPEQDRRAAGARLMILILCGAMFAIFILLVTLSRQTYFPSSQITKKKSE
jgi:hypothetical protein